MASLRDIKRRRDSVKSTQKITRAMKMVAASKLRRAQEAVVGARPYAQRMRALVDDLASRAELDAHPLLRRPGEGGPLCLIVVTGDRGLCGAYNSNLVNATTRALAEQFAGRSVDLVVIGRKGIEALKRRNANIVARHTGVQEGSPLRAAREIVGAAAAGFTQRRYDEVSCLFNEFRSAISQRVTIERLLPFERRPPDGTPAADYLYEPSMESVFGALLSQHLETQMHRILFEAAASEYGARMTAMDAATKNAGEMIARLTLQYNRARQDAITKELLEVVAGAEAL